MMNQTKTNRYFLFFLCFLFSTLSVQAKVNPIMIIKCQDEEVLRSQAALRAEVTSIPIDCDEGFECPAGTVKVNNDGECECVPDCTVLGSAVDCNEGCLEPLRWLDNDKICGCTVFGGEFSFDAECGCPPWFETVPGIFRSDSCIIQETPCYDGNIMVTIDAVECENLNDGGQVTVDIDITVPAGACIQLEDLLNCELSSGEDFVLELSDVYASDAAFCDDDDDGLIEVQILKEPFATATIAFTSVDDIIIPACAPIPTMGTWALIILGLLMVIFGVAYVVKSRGLALPFLA